jgi:hypothetical protein
MSEAVSGSEKGEGLFTTPSDVNGDNCVRWHIISLLIEDVNAIGFAIDV